MKALEVEKIKEMLSNGDEKKTLDACIQIYEDPDKRLLKPLLSALEKTEDYSPENNFILRVCFKMCLMHPGAIDELIQHSDKINKVTTNFLSFYIFLDKSFQKRRSFPKQNISKLINLGKTHSDINVRILIIKIFAYMRITEPEVIDFLMEASKKDVDEVRWWALWSFSILGLKTDEITDFLIYVIKNEKNPWVAVEPILTLGRLHMKNAKTMRLLKGIVEKGYCVQKIGAFFSLIKFGEMIDDGIDYFIETYLNDDVAKILEENRKNKDFFYEMLCWTKKSGIEHLLTDKKINIEKDFKILEYIHHKRIKSESVWCLGAIAVDNPYLKDYHKQKIIKFLLEIIKNEKDKASVHWITWSLCELNAKEYMSADFHKLNNLYIYKNFHVSGELNEKDRSIIEFLLNKIETNKNWWAEEDAIWALNKLNKEGRIFFVSLLDSKRESFYITSDALYFLERMTKKDIPVSF
ncbi:MAG: HEAT repeat domain-containing protein [Nanoarchaeota archaeon]